MGHGSSALHGTYLALTGPNHRVGTFRSLQFARGGLHVRRAKSVQQNVQQGVQHENEAIDLSICYSAEKSNKNFGAERFTRSNSNFNELVKNSILPWLKADANFASVFKFDFK
jgi:hypothetical protein